MPWIYGGLSDCATFEDDVLSCAVPDVQMCSRCVPVHPYVPVLCQHLYMFLTVMLLCGRCVFI